MFPVDIDKVPVTVTILEMPTLLSPAAPVLLTDTLKNVSPPVLVITWLFAPLKITVPDPGLNMPPVFVQLPPIRNKPFAVVVAVFVKFPDRLIIPSLKSWPAVLVASLEVITVPVVTFIDAPLLLITWALRPGVTNKINEQKRIDLPREEIAE